VSPAVLVLLALIPTVSQPALVEANGGTLRLDTVRAGPYLVSLWTQPTPPRVGILDVSLAVVQSPSNEAVLDATACLTAESLDRRSTATATLIPGGGRNPLLHHGNLGLPSAGGWRLTVRVEGQAGVGQAGLELEVQPAASLDWRLLGAALVLVVVAAWWTMVRARPASIEEAGSVGEPRRDQPNGSPRR
jgi:hypothetical protein